MKRRVGFCVAEKPSVAKAMVEFLSHGRANKVNSRLMIKIVDKFSFEV